jgi:tetratricopeptide (TPR) repeat protein
MTALNRAGGTKIAAAGLAALVWLAPACAPKVVPPTAPGAPRFPDYVFPAVPASFKDPQLLAKHEAAWRALQSGDFREAVRAFSELLKRTPAFYPADAGLGFAQTADGKFPAALASFERALKAGPRYAPALAGRAEAYAAGGQTDLAIENFELARAADPRLADLGRRIEVLRFARVNELVAAAKKAADDGRLDEARKAYQRAIATSPDSAFLHRDLGLAALRAGDTDAAIDSLSAASRLDPDDVRTWMALASAHEKAGQVVEAVAELERALALEPNESTRASIARLRERLETQRFPPEYQAIPSAAQITRGDLAALLGLRVVPLLPARRGGGVVVTDARGHWAATWILAATRAGLMDVFANHTFQPKAAVRRVELAQVVSRVIAALPPSARRPPPAIADVPAQHLSYPAISSAVGSGVIPLLDGGAFRPSRPVSGAEAVDVVGRLESLAKKSRGKEPRS